MLFSLLRGIWCQQCKKYLDPYTEVYLSVLDENSITCDKDHIVGYITDQQWLEFWGEEK